MRQLRAGARMAFSCAIPKTCIPGRGSIAPIGVRSLSTRRHNFNLRQRNRWPWRWFSRRRISVWHGAAPALFTGPPGTLVRGRSISPDREKRPDLTGLGASISSFIHRYCFGGAHPLAKLEMLTAERPLPPLAAALVISYRNRARISQRATWASPKTESLSSARAVNLSESRKMRSECRERRTTTWLSGDALKKVTSTIRTAQRFFCANGRTSRLIEITICW